VTAADAPRARIVAAFIAVYLLWGSSYLATRVGVLQFPPFLFGGIRFVTAGLIMLAIARLNVVRVLPTGREWRDLLVLALTGFVCANGVGVWTMQYVASNQAALLNTTAPCWIVLLGTLGAHAHRPGRRALLGLLLGFSGALLLLLPAAIGRGTASPLLPQLIIVGGCLAWAVSTIYLRNMGTGLSVLPLIGWQMLLGGIGLAAIGLASQELPRWHWSTLGALALVFQILLASCIGHTCYAWLARRVSPSQLGTYAYVNPVIATLLGWLLLGERLVAVQVAGMVIALSGVALISWRADASR
jgi:drug/metabolite transporter (DMT)-like permease